jgi:hypothetical protein
VHPGFIVISWLTAAGRVRMKSGVGSVSIASNCWTSSGGRTGGVVIGLDAFTSALGGALRR